MLCDFCRELGIAGVVSGALNNSLNSYADGHGDRGLPANILDEAYQEEDGVRVPKSLQPYMCGIDFIPFKKAAVNGRQQPGRSAPNQRCLTERGSIA